MRWAASVYRVMFLVVAVVVVLAACGGDVCGGDDGGDAARMSCSVRRRRSGTLGKSGRHGDRARKDSDQSRSKRD